MSRSFLCWFALAGLSGVVSPAVARAHCAKTPDAAIQSSRMESISSSSSSVSEDKGYRVTGVRWDPVLNQKWAMIARCDHPEWPELSLRAEEKGAASRPSTARIRQEAVAAGAADPAVAVVRAGDVVHLWRQEALLRIEVTGVAEESGSVGKSIRVRLLRRTTDDQSIEEQFSGIVRGRADVEMQP